MQTLFYAKAFSSMRGCKAAFSLVPLCFVAMSVARKNNYSFLPMNKVYPFVDLFPTPMLSPLHSTTWFVSYAQALACVTT